MNNIVNLTPHAITLRLEGGKVEKTFIISGTQARVAVRATTRDSLINDGIQIPVIANEYGEVEGLPESREGTIYIVSALVLGRVSGRSDVFAPDTGPTAVRNASGQIEAVTRLIAAK